jgi:hypothetical protein
MEKVVRQNVSHKYRKVQTRAGDKYFNREEYAEKGYNDDRMNSHDYVGGDEDYSEW